MPSKHSTILQPRAHPCVQCGSLFSSMLGISRAGRGKFCSQECRTGYAVARNTARFWAMVDRSAGADGCWPWRGLCDPGRYGIFMLAIGYKRQRKLQAHRYAFELMKGPIPDGLFACHRCDNPPCCNPGHIWPGTRTANNLDRQKKGRTARGERIGRTKLTANQVLEIRTRRLMGASLSQLAKEFAVGKAAISAIDKRRNWKHI